VIINHADDDDDDVLSAADVPLYFVVYGVCVTNLAFVRQFLAICLISSYKRWLNSTQKINTTKYKV
jgi:hypothetical protein